jgi:Holliday junction resolvase RusA-like endonuclease
MKTEKQKEFCKALINKGRFKTVKRDVITENVVECKITDYMHNCVYWIEQHLAGNVSYEKFSDAMKSLQVHINECHKLSKK